jgi:hypothetical protein
MSDERLLIGGANDGERHFIPDSLTYYRTAKGVEYRREHWRANAIDITVFVEVHITIEEALRLMIANYRRGRD